MMERNAFPLIGIYRPRRNAPGFGIPIFNVQHEPAVQSIAADGCIEKFLPCDVDEDSLRSMDEPAEPVTRAPGQNALYAFEDMNGEIILGESAMISQWLRQNVLHFASTPFVLQDIADFIADPELAAIVGLLSDTLISNTRERLESIPLHITEPSLLAQTTAADSDVQQYAVRLTVLRTESENWAAWYAHPSTAQLLDYITAEDTPMPTAVTRHLDEIGCHKCLSRKRLLQLAASNPGVNINILSDSGIPPRFTIDNWLFSQVYPHYATAVGFTSARTERFDLQFPLGNWSIKLKQAGQRQGTSRVFTVGSDTHEPVLAQFVVWDAQETLVAQYAFVAEPNSTHDLLVNELPATFRIGITRLAKLEALDIPLLRQSYDAHQSIFSSQNIWLRWATDVLPRFSDDQAVLAELTRIAEDAGQDSTQKSMKSFVENINMLVDNTGTPDLQQTRLAKLLARLQAPPASLFDGMKLLTQDDLATLESCFAYQHAATWQALTDACLSACGLPADADTRLFCRMLRSAMLGALLSHAVLTASRSMENYYAANYKLAKHLERLVTCAIGPSSCWPELEQSVFYNTPLVFTDAYLSALAVSTRQLDVEMLSLLRDWVALFLQSSRAGHTLEIPILGHNSAEGVGATLCLRTRKRGHGLCYPDPQGFGFNLLSADMTQAADQAWHAARRLLAAWKMTPPANIDLTWWIQPTAMFEYGASFNAALALLCVASQANIRMHPHRTISARCDEHGQLHPVAYTGPKMDAAFQQRLHRVVFCAPHAGLSPEDRALAQREYNDAREVALRKQIPAAVTTAATLEQAFQLLLREEQSMITLTDFHELLQTPANDTLHYYEHYDWNSEQDVALFVKHVLSLANTPRDGSARLVIGVKQGGHGSLCRQTLRDNDDQIQQMLAAQITPALNVVVETLEVPSPEGVRFATILTFPPDSDGPYCAQQNLPTPTPDRPDRHPVVQREILYYRGPVGKIEHFREYDQYRQLWDLMEGRTPFSRYIDWKSILDAAKSFNARDYNYMLIAPPMTDATLPFLRPLGLLPWTAVFDLDPHSQETGLLKQVHELPAQKRLIYHLQPDDVPGEIEASIQWYFARGMVGGKDNYFDGDDADYRDWRAKCYKELQKSTYKLAGLRGTSKPVICLVPFYSETERIHRTLQDMFTLLLDQYGTMTFVLLTDAEHEAAAQQFSRDFKAQLFIAPLNALHEQLVRWQMPTGAEGSVQLRNRDKELIDIFPDELNFWETEVELVHHTIGEQLPDMRTVGLDFLRGNEIHWSDFADRQDRRWDAARDITPEILRTIEWALTENRQLVCNIRHEPGAGGTTVARRIAWDLHDRFPCLFLRHRPHRETVAIIEEIYSKTQAALLLVSDGNTTKDDIEGLYVSLRARKIPFVILHVFRQHHIDTGREVAEYTTKKSGERVTEERYITTANLLLKLSEKEAKLFVECYLQVKSEANEEILTQLAEGPDETRNAFYFGLEAFRQHFIKLDDYVKHHIADLPADNRQVESEILFHLAMASYYSHNGSIPESHFSIMLPSENNEPIHLESVLSPIARELAIKDPGNNWKIIHPLIAARIIRHDGIINEKRLDDKARAFARFCRGNTALPVSQHMLDLAENTFLFRDSVDYGVQAIADAEISDQRGQREYLYRKRFSQLLLDIADAIAGANNHTQQMAQLQVFEYLVGKDMFEDHAHFQAHLGRFYYDRMHQYDKARGCLQRAVEINEKDSVIWHMYGMLYRFWASSKIEEYRRQSNRAGQTPPDEQLFLGDVINYSKEASEKFHRSRAVTANNLHAFISEIQTLVKMLYFYRDIARSKNEDFYTCIEDDPDMFVRMALHNASRLLDAIRDIRGNTEPDRFELAVYADVRDLYGEIDKIINSVEQDINRLAHLNKPMRRQHILLFADAIRRQSEAEQFALVKINGENERLTYRTLRERALDKIPQPRIIQVANWLSQCIDEEPDNDVYYLRWLAWIRRDRSGTIDVNRIIDRLNYPLDTKTTSDSLRFHYYLYILHFLKCLDGQVNFSFREMQKHLNLCKSAAEQAGLNDTYSWEWLGAGAGLYNSLVPSNSERLGEWADIPKRFWDNSDVLRRMRGTIVDNEKPQSGTIRLIVPGVTQQFPPVFFQPHKTQGTDDENFFNLTHKKNSLVEFYLGFSYSGFRAWKVQSSTSK